MRRSAALLCVLGPLSDAMSMLRDEAAPGGAPGTSLPSTPHAAAPVTHLKSDAGQAYATIHEHRAAKSRGVVHFDADHRVMDDGTEFVWQSPSNAVSILVLLHGCHHSALDFWPASPTRCPKCIGLPAQTAYVASALEDGWACVAITAKSDEDRCWHREHDLPRIHRALEWVAHTLGNKHLPMAVIGAGSGGAMAEELAMTDFAARGRGQMYFLGTVVMINHSPLTLEEPCDQIVCKHHVPTKFISMITNTISTDTTQRQIAVLKNHEIDAEQILGHPTPVKASSFMSRHGGEAALKACSRNLVTCGKAEEVMQILRDGNFLDARGQLLADPATGTWRSALRAILPETEDPFDSGSNAGTIYHSPVYEVLKIAYGSPTFSDIGITMVYQWLDGMRTAYWKAAEMKANLVHNADASEEIFHDPKLPSADRDKDDDAKLHHHGELKDGDEMDEVDETDEVNATLSQSTPKPSR